MDPDWKKTVSDIATKAIAARFQPILDQGYEEYAGHPTETIKPILAQRWATGTTALAIQRGTSN